MRGQTSGRGGLAGWALHGLLALCLALPWVGARGEPAGAASWQGVDRVVAFADVHGAYEELTALLRAAGVVDAELRWSGGRAHLVSLGDLLDRGADSRKVMDLLMRLQDEARQAGGRVHVVVGNHEAMNVLGDLRYVVADEYAAYAADEDPAQRTAELAAFLTRQPGATPADFARMFPPGYFGHRRLLGPHSVYGKWLLGLPVAVQVNDTVYMHGGPSGVLQGRSLEQLNRDYAAALADYLAAAETLRQAGLLQIEDAYAKRPDAAQSRLDALAASDARVGLAAAVTRFRGADDAPLLGPRGPNWYRGAAFCNECAEADVLKPWLRAIGARRVVIGHTVARNATVVSRFDGAVVKLDAGMNRAVYQGRPAALVSDATGSRVVYADTGPAPAAVPAEPLYLSSQVLDEPAVLEILTRGTVEVTESCAPGVDRVVVSLDGRRVDAVFEAATRQAAAREVAAFRIDRLLGLGLVPATVARRHAGQDGILQGRPASWVSEQDRQNASAGARAGLVCQTISTAPQAEPARRPPPPDGRRPRLPAGGWCDLAPQFQLSYAFDALLDNRGRSFDRFLYDADTSTLFLSGHGSAFGTATQFAKPLEAQLPQTGAEMQARLRRLDAASVGAEIGELVGERAVKALLQRRDRILELAAARPAP